MLKDTPRGGFQTGGSLTDRGHLGPRLNQERGRQGSCAVGVWPAVILQRPVSFVIETNQILLQDGLVAFWVNDSTVGTSASMLYHSEISTVIS